MLCAEIVGTSKTDVMLALNENDVRIEISQHGPAAIEGSRIDDYYFVRDALRVSQNRRDTSLEIVLGVPIDNNDGEVDGVHGSLADSQKRPSRKYWAAEKYAGSVAVAGNELRLRPAPAGRVPDSQSKIPSTKLSIQGIEAYEKPA